MTARPKIPPVDQSACRPDIAEMLSAGSKATGGADNVAATLANNPGLFRRLMPLAGKLLTAGTLSARDRELAILRTAWLCRCEYEWIHHVRIGRDVGLADDDIRAVKHTAGHSGWTEHDQAILSATDQLVKDHRVTDTTYEQLSATLNTEQLVELLILVGNYAMLAGFLNSLDVVHDSAENNDAIDTFTRSAGPSASA